MEMLPVDQIPRSVTEDASRQVCDFSIGFVRVKESASGQQTGLGGSGTLVQLGKDYGILTACHVLDQLQRDQTIGLLVANAVAPIIQRVTIPSTTTRFIRIRFPCAHRQEQGPDLGLLLLSQVDAGALKARKSFYNLEKRDWILNGPPALNDGIWFLCGFADESTTVRGPERGFERVTSFLGACGRGVVQNESQEGGFDYLDFEVGYGGENEPPRDFGGFSGGGLWQAQLLRTPDGILKVKELLLSGVAFYQYPGRNDRGVVKCHGRRSVYGLAINPEAS